MDYINLHVSSTVLNERIEIRQPKPTLRPHAHKLPSPALTSIIAHPHGACGAAAVAATLLAMRDNRLHPTLNVDVPDPECDLDYIPHHSREGEIEHAICNCIAFGSKNSALVISRVAAN